jgi:hypothetical protein
LLSLGIVQASLTLPSLNRNFHLWQAKEFMATVALLILPYDSGTVDELACAKIFIGWRKKWLGEYHLTKNNLIFVTEKS